MKESLRPVSVPRLSLPISRMFIAWYLVLAVEVADGGRLPVGIADGAREMLETDWLTLTPK
jgi:hypothetical protein